MKKLLTIIIVLALVFGLLYLLNTKGYIVTKDQHEQAVAQAYEDGYQAALNDMQASIESSSGEEEGSTLLDMFGEAASDLKDYLSGKIADYIRSKLP